jgi:hypothetical protein
MTALVKIYKKTIEYEETVVVDHCAMTMALLAQENVSAVSSLEYGINENPD